MKFHKMLKKMLKDPKAKFYSHAASAKEQDLDSIKFWFCTDPVEQARLKNFDKFTSATDWTKHE